MVSGAKKLGASMTGVLNDIQGSQEEKNKSSEELQSNGVKEPKKKRSYMLKLSTIKKVEEMKVYLYDAGTDYSDIVEDAINALYESKKGSK